jgi:hypothetical protein
MPMSVRWLTASELHGQGSDMSMLLDADLRARLLKYGDLAQATYDGFDRLPPRPPPPAPRPRPRRP